MSNNTQNHRKIASEVLSNSFNKIVCEGAKGSEKWVDFHTVPLTNGHTVNIWFYRPRT